jgi:hypothetical protein
MMTGEHMHNEKLKEALFDFATRSDVLVEARQETAYYAAYAEAFRPVQFMVYMMTGMLVLAGDAPQNRRSKHL